MQRVTYLKARTRLIIGAQDQENREGDGDWERCQVMALLYLVSVRALRMF